ncbi:MAG TPA: gamma-glutamylcyclotransferase [Acetobacteraceae bacterium]|jgi:cation transport protein ChaC
MNATEEEEGPPDMPRALTREFLMEGTLPAILARASPSLRVLTEEERSASLRDLLANRPLGTDGVWVFAYGSLIWNPTVHFLESRPAIVQGWHRAFCLSVAIARGTPENPGLMLGLQPGGSCAGVAFLIGEDVMEQELTLLWRREMVAGGYIPVWVPLEQDGERFAQGIVFTINPAGPAYVGDLPEAEVVRRLATAKGGLGSAAEYLFRTRDGLRQLGMADPLVERLGELVTTAQRNAASA